ncbi:hypothetical protein PHMEG_00013691, partial [Phytophthora megakarya]
MVVKYADGKPLRLPRRSVTFSYEFDGFRGSDDFMIIELSGLFDCIFGIPWLARHQTHIDWLTKTARPHDIDVNAVLASLSGMPNTWPHVAVMDPDSMTSAAHEECDGPSCAVCEHAACAGPEQGSQDVSNVVEQWFPRSDDQRLSDDNDVVEYDLPLAAEHEFPRVIERELPEEEKEEVVERGLPQAVERVLPRVVERELPVEVDALESDSVGTESEVISVLVESSGTSRVCDIEVAHPPRDAAEITQLPDLPWKHFLSDLKKGYIEQVCMLVHEATACAEAVEVAADDPASDTRTRPKGAEPKSARDPAVAGTIGRDSTHEAGSALVNGVTTRHGARDAARAMRMRAATRAAPERSTQTTARGLRARVAARTTPSGIATWASRTLINPSQRRSAIEYHEATDAAGVAAPPPANFDPNPEPQSADTAAVNALLDRRQSVAQYVRDAIAMAVDRQRENADRRGRKNMEKFAVGDRVLLSTAGIQPTLVTNLGANKLAPRFIEPFKILKVLGDAYTLQLPTALRLHPTFYVGRLRRYHPAVIPSVADTPTVLPSASLDAPAPRAEAPAPHPARDANPPSHAPAASTAPLHDDDPAQPPPPPTDPAPRFQRDGPAPLSMVLAVLATLSRRSWGTMIIVSSSSTRVRVAVALPATVQSCLTTSTSCGGLAPCLIVGSLERCCSRTFQIALRHTRRRFQRRQAFRVARPSAAPSF